jgi:superfamily II DNA or RNA helicase
MIYTEIIKKFLSKNLNRNQAEIELKSELNKHIYRGNMRKASKIRYCIYFMLRYEQFIYGELSLMDYLVFLRDFLIHVGRIQVTEQIHKLVQQKGRLMDIIAEKDNYVSVTLRLPSWFHDREFVEEVYGIKDMTISCSQRSVGDNWLRKYTKFQHYKSFEQKIAVHTALSLPGGYTYLLSLPTGGGKSLVTQMLAGMSPGLTIIIVPTVALALDQCRAADENLSDVIDHDAIYCYRGDMDPYQATALFHAIKNSTARLLFTSPEALMKNANLVQAIENAAQSQYLKNVIIDEAHIVPDWGVFFRYDFQLFAIALKKYRELSDNTIRTYLLSATLSNDVVGALRQLFSNGIHFVEFRSDALRSEPRFCYYSVKDRNVKDSYIIDLAKLLPKPMIIYVIAPYQAQILQERLMNEGFRNIPTFTGETTDDMREQILNGWNEGKYDIVIATSAFGMGVDKSDVRTILHACMPENLSRFYQEVGRAGRDGLPSLSVSVPFMGNKHENGDAAEAFGLVNKRIMTVEKMVMRWFNLMNSPRTILNGDIAVFDMSTTDHSLLGEEDEYNGNKNIAWNVNLILLFFRSNFIDVIDAVFLPDQRTYHITVKLLEIAALTNRKVLEEKLTPIRQDEYRKQVEGFYSVRELFQKPKSMCWGKRFTQLFPLAPEKCNGCPKDKETIYNADDGYHIHKKIQYERNVNIEHYAKRLMGAYNSLLIRQDDGEVLSGESVQKVAEIMKEMGIKTMVVPNEIASRIAFDGLLLIYEEFWNIYQKCPILFVEGVALVFGDNANDNNVVFERGEVINNKGYPVVYYCKESMFIEKHKRTMSNFYPGYRKELSEIRGGIR